MKLDKPPFPKMLKRSSDFPLRTKWDDSKPASAVDNIPPQSLWPIKRGVAVIYIDSRFQQPCVNSGRVSWFNPAREIDASCVTSAGHPFFNIKNESQNHSQLVCVCDVFPFTEEGWKDCLMALSRNLQSLSRSALSESHKLEVYSDELLKISLSLKRQSEKAK